MSEHALGPAPFAPKGEALSVRAALERFVHGFESDFVLDGEIVDSPEKLWGQVVNLYRIGKVALSAPPPPEPAVRWCLKDPRGKTDFDNQWPSENHALNWMDEAEEYYVGWSVVRVEIREVPE